jgi:flagellar assembly protein FliH
MNSSNSHGRCLHVGRVIRDLKPAAGKARPAHPAPARPTLINPRHPSPPDAPAPDDEYERGFREGRAAHEKELQQLATLFRNATEAFERARREMLNGMDEHATVLALAIARKVIGHELRDPATLQRILARAVEQMAARTGTRARLNPSDLALLEAHRERLQASGARLPEELVLCPDPTVGRGGCILDGPHESLDATIETQLALIEEALRASETPGAERPAHAGPANPA